MGEKKLHEGKGWMKKTMFRWQPDTAKAAQSFSEAAREFRKAGNFVKYAEAQEALGGVYYVDQRLLKGAQEVESGALMALEEQKEYKLAARLYSKAAEWYLEKGTIDRAARTLIKAGKALEKDDLQMAAGFMLKAMKLYHIPTEGKRVANMDTYNIVLAFLVRNKRLDEADKCIEIQLKHFDSDIAEYIRYVWKAWLSRAVISLAKGDMKSTAEILDYAFTKVPRFGETPFGKAAVQLIELVADAKEDAFNKLMKGQEFRVLDNEIARLAKKAEFPKLSEDESKAFKELAKKVFDFVESDVKAREERSAPVQTEELDIT